ncbi:BRO-N domain-containing protein [Bilophila wadsworthia]|uniref:BRO-N domain-containing protein n=2 Tax=Bilophila wadsworthia TaxID=35833 RepID=UPI0026DBB51B|nr:Bro-N domain-containing protein [Bilophila wadsworthia]
MTMQVLPYVFQEQLVRARLDEQGNPWFVAKDVCAVLDIQDHHQAIEQLDDDERGRCTVPTPGGMQELKVISESGLYALIFRSRKPEAKAFSKWMRSEVLPNLRKTGGYGAPAQAALGVSREELEELIAGKVVDAVFRYRHVLADSVEGVKALEATRPVPPAEPTEREILEQCIRDYVAEVGAAHDVATARDERKPIVNPNMARGNVLLNITHFSEWFGAHKAASRLRIFTTQALSGALRRMHCRKVNLAYLRPDGGKSSFSLYVTNIHS